MSSCFKQKQSLILKKILTKKAKNEKPFIHQIEVKSEQRPPANAAVKRGSNESERCEEAKHETSERRSKLARVCDQKLKESQFRAINEYLYTHSSDESSHYLNEALFDVYHEAYASVVNKWPIKPIDVIVDAIESHSPHSRKRLIIADMGCGKMPLLKLHFNQATVYSFDLIAAHEHVIQANITSVPLQDCICDFVVFCLSLMGTNVNDYLVEGNRILKLNGRLLIAEVVSRFEDVDKFAKSLKSFGFSAPKVQFLPPNKYFVVFDCAKKTDVKDLKANLPEITLKPCHYKAR
ncbi:Cerebral protein-like protein [Dinothrombium tinctorium]|uniref:Ribosomal RNA-processing protein 8 n=1 Tax=Dinothrombium tinctorium TaxID=1965070 RepID=A0A443RCT2_9ACAR|nr:Cerebral protein-like protein [Dinothrombium tinctorium]